MSLLSAVEDAVARFPGEPAWLRDDRAVTYRRLGNAVARLTGALAEAGVGPGDRVGLFLARGIDVTTAVLATMRAGAAVVPLGVDDPPLRQADVLRDADPVVVLTHPPTSARFAHATPTIDIGTAIASAHPAGRTDGDAAFVLYTSGSTGRPRGVVVAHDNLVGHLRWLAEHLPLGPGDRLLQVAPHTFDASITDICWPLSGGAAIVTLADGEQLDPLAVADTLAGQRITAVRLPPAILPALLAEPRLRAARDLRYLICGGDRLPAALARRVRAALPWVRLINRYGPTEAAVAVTYHEVTAQDMLGTGDVPIGRPITGVALHLMTGTGAVTGIEPGRAGEILIGGPQVTRGYLGDAVLTAERFVDLPGLGRVFRSGDLAEVDADGALVFTGRTDEQVQVAGNRVELGEVRAALNAHPAVAGCVVLPRRDTGATLVAYVVPAGDPPDIRALRAFLMARLPRHMVPSGVTFLDRLPLTDRGKVDVAALTEMDRSHRAVGDTTPV